MAVLYGTMQNGQLVPVEADAQGRLVAQLAVEPPRYQEGSWTPTLTHGAVGTAVCSWSRIGNVVTLAATLTSFSDTTSTAQIAISGIPFSRDDQFVIGSIRTSFLNFGEGNSVHSSLNIGDLIKVGVSTPSIGGTAAVAASYVGYNSFISAQAADTQLVISITYRTDDTTWIPINGAT